MDRPPKRKLLQPFDCHETNELKLTKKFQSTLLAVLIALLLAPGVSKSAQSGDTGTEQITLLRAKAAIGDAHSQFELGQAFYFGKFGLATNYGEAVKWFQQAAEQNHAAAQNMLGVAYANGHGVPQNSVEAARWYRKAADQGVPAA
jgi:TPR repeat protein